MKEKKIDDAAVLKLIDSLPLTPAEKVEIAKAYERSCSIYWVNARERMKKLCEERRIEKKDRKRKWLLTDDKVNQLVPIDDELKQYCEDLWFLGYSSAAISKATGFAVSSARISQLNPPIDKKKRGQVIELLDDFENDFDWKLWVSKFTPTTPRQGSKITDEEKEKFKSWYEKGYSVQHIAKYFGRSENAVRRWVK